MQNIQVGRTAIAGIGMLFGQFGSAIRIAWFPLLLLVVLQGVMAALILPEIEAMTAAMETSGEAGIDAVELQAAELIASSGWKLIVLGILTLGATAMLTTGWIQQVLRGDALGHGAGFFRFGGRELRVVLAGILFMLLMAIVMAIVAAAGIGFSYVTTLPSIVLVLPAGFAAYVLVLRLVLIFPMIAVGQGIGWRAAWELTRGNTWRLFFALLLMGLLSMVLSFAVSIPVGIVTTLLSFLVPGSIALTVVVPIAAQTVVTVFVVMIQLGSLAEAYRQLGGPGVGVPEATLAVFDDA